MSICIPILKPGYCWGKKKGGKMGKREEWEKFVAEVKQQKCEIPEKIKNLVGEFPLICDTDPTKVKAIIVTEQAVGKKDVCKSYFDIPNNTPNRINDFIGENKFKESVVKGEGPFYWTHAIKYPLKKDGRKVANYFKNKKVIEKELKNKGNAYFLKREIEILAPKLIILFGDTAFKLCDSFKNELFEDFPKTQISAVSTTFRPTGEKVEIIYLPHPSGINRSWNVVKKITDIIKKVRDVR